MKRIPFGSSVMKLNRQRNTRGFTLLEVMIAVAVLAIALVSLLGSQSQTISVATDARFDTVAALLAQEKMAEIRLLDFEQVESDSGTFEEGFSEFSWSTEVLQVLEDDIAIPDTDGMLKQVILIVALAEDERQHLTVQTTIFKKIVPGDENQ